MAITDANSENGEAVVPARRFWLVADDYAISPAVSAAIRDLIARRRLNATSVMVVTPSFDAAEAQALAVLKRDIPGLAIGLHLTLTAPFRPLTAAFAPLRAGVFPSLGILMRHAFLRQLADAKVEAEAAAQLARFSAAFGQPPDFVDGHQHVHLLPGIRRAVIAATKQAAPQAWLRQCGGALPLWRQPLRAKALFIDWLSRGLAHEAAAAGLATNPAFAGAYRYATGADFSAVFPTFLASLPQGGVVMCHPGIVDAELQRLDPLTTLREQEYAYLGGPDFPRILAKYRLTL